MKRYFLSALFSILLTGVVAIAAPASITTVTQGGRLVSVTAVMPGIIKVTNSPADVAVPDSKMLLAPEAPYDFTKVQKTPNTTVMQIDGESPVDVTLVNRTGAVAITLANGATIIDNGMRNTATGKQVLTLGVPEGGRWLGGGERGHSLDLSGDTLVNYNRPTYGYGAGDPRINQMNITAPIVYSTNGFALVFDDFAASELILGNPVEYVTESSSPVTYYVVTSADDEDQSLAWVNVNASRLIGTQPTAPLWTLGYITSKYGYKTSDETLATVDRLQKGGYPLDGIVLDLYWYGSETDMGRFDWEPAQWPDHKTMLAQLKSKNVNLLNISQPFVLRNGKGLENYNFLAQNGLLVPDSAGRPGEVKIWVGEGGMLDVSNPATRSWMVDRYAEMRRDGVAGFWGDLGEPEQHPDSLVHHNGLKAREYHNLYGNEWASVIRQMMEKNYPGERFMTLMRGGTIGLQRESVFPWSGDVARSWEGMQAQIPIMINSGLSGFGYMSHDIGGFAVDPASPIDPELYIRWLQMGLFTPTLRTHAQQGAEPFNYPEIENDYLLPLIKERYRWLPYNYSHALFNAAQGVPFVTPLSYYFPEFEDEPYRADDQYMWSEGVMVAPVLHAGQTSRPVAFPGKGLRWMDMNHPERIFSDTLVMDYQAPLTEIPHFLKAGSVIPFAEYPMTSTADYRADDYTLWILPDNRIPTTACFFEDDMKTAGNNALGKGVITQFVDVDATNPEKIVLSFYSEGQPEDITAIGGDRHYTVKVFDVAKKPKSVIGFEGKKLKFSYDKATRCVTFETVYHTVPGMEASSAVINL